MINEADDLPYDSVEGPILAPDSIARRTAGSKLTVEVRRKLKGISNTAWSDLNDDSCRVQYTLRA
jgi:hypothetical protein